MLGRTESNDKLIQYKHRIGLRAQEIVMRFGIVLAVTIPHLCEFSWSGGAYAQEKLLARTVEFIVPWGSGGGADQVARLLSKKLESNLGVPFPVVNYPGASGTIGIARLLNASADSHSIAVLTGDTLSAMASGTGNLKLEELTALGVFVRQPSGLFIRYDSKYKTWTDVLSSEKVNPGKISVATTGPGSMDDMTIDYLNSKGINLLGVPYPKPGERYAAVIGGHIDFLYEQAGDIKGHLEGKVLRPILFFTSKRIPAFPDVAAAGEFGYQLMLTQFRAVVAKTGVTRTFLDALSTAMERHAKSDEFNTYLREQLAAPDSYIPASQAQGFLQLEFNSMRRFANPAQGPSK